MARLLRAFAIQIAVVIALLLGGLAVHAYRTQPRPARALVERELREGILAEGERVVNLVSVFRRRPSDYFRATRGVLALTGERLVYVGIAPRDILGPEEPVPVFESRDFVPDTLLQLSSGRTLLGAARALRLERGDEEHTFGVADGEWEEAQRIVTEVQRRHAVARSEAERLRRLRFVADSIERAPKYHVVQRGEALISIANAYNTTPEVLRELNELPDDRIRVGQRLLVKPQT